jgi:hypothetical protein
MLTTTFQNIRKHRPCESGYRKLAKALGGIKSYGDATPIPILNIIETTGIDDALWCFRTVEDKAAARLVEVGFLIWLLADPEEGVIRFVQGDARTRQREAIEGVIKLLIRDGKWDAARASARDAAEAAAGAAAWSARAAWAAAGAAARDAAGDAAWDAARGAAWSAARAAARDAAGDAAWSAAWSAARDAAGDAQARKLAEILSAREQGER